MNMSLVAILVFFFGLAAASLAVRIAASEASLRESSEAATARRPASAD